MSSFNVLNKPILTYPKVTDTGTRAQRCNHSVYVARTRNSKPNLSVPSLALQYQPSQETCGRGNTLADIVGQYLLRHKAKMYSWYRFPLHLDQWKF